MPEPPKLSWHGFSSLVGFVRATFSLGLTITLGLWAMLTWAMDDRYVKHEDLRAAVADIKSAVKDTVVELSCQSLLEDMTRLEQTIRYKRTKGEDTGLEVDLLAADQRRLNQYSGCVRN
jgi:hypothetical protein